MWLNKILVVLLVMFFLQEMFNVYGENTINIERQTLYLDKNLNQNPPPMDFNLAEVYPSYSYPLQTIVGLNYGDIVNVKGTDRTYGRVGFQRGWQIRWAVSMNAAYRATSSDIITIWTDNHGMESFSAAGVVTVLRKGTADNDYFNDINVIYFETDETGGIPVSFGN